MIVTNKEKGIIDIFYEAIIKHKNNQFIFMYDKKRILCTFDTAYETDNCLEENDLNYEEYFALCFNNDENNQLFEVNYHNVPDLVYVNEELIYKK